MYHEYIWVVGEMWDLENGTGLESVGQFWGGLGKSVVNAHLYNFLDALMVGISKTLVDELIR